MKFSELIAELDKNAISAEKKQEMEKLSSELMQSPEKFLKIRTIWRWAFIPAVGFVVYSFYLLVLFRDKTSIPYIMASTLILSAVGIGYAVWVGNIKGKAKLNVVKEVAKKFGWKFSDQKNKNFGLMMKENFGNLLPEGVVGNYTGFSNPFWGEVEIDGKDVQFFAGSLEYLKGNGESSTIIYHFLLGFDVSKFELQDKEALLLSIEKKLFVKNPFEAVKNAQKIFEAQQAHGRTPGAIEAYSLEISGKEDQLSSGQSKVLSGFVNDLTAKVGEKSHPSFYSDGKMAVLLLGGYCDPYKEIQTDFFKSGVVDNVDVKRLEEVVKLSGEFLRKFLG